MHPSPNPLTPAWTKLREIAQRTDDPELHAIWPQVWMLEDRQAAIRWQKDRQKEKLVYAVLVYAVVPAGILAERYGTTAAEVGKICKSNGYSLHRIKQQNYWIAAGTKYPLLNLKQDFGL